MKINPLFDAFRFLSPSALVGAKKDGEGGGGNSQHQEQRQGKNGEPGQGDDIIEVSEERIEAAVEAFGADAKNKSSELEAAVVGKGLGVRVLLKDGTGAVIRQFTGEEFLRLREAASKDSRKRGGLLDQKL